MPRRALCATPAAAGARPSAGSHSGAPVDAAGPGNSARPSCPPTAFNYQRLGLIKYGLAAGVALLWAVAACAWHVPWLLPLAAVAFYAVEAQMVFLFPLALDGSAVAFRCRLAAWTRPAPAAQSPRCRWWCRWLASRSSAALPARGFVRLVVPRMPRRLYLWYEELRQRPADRGADPGSPSNGARPAGCLCGAVLRPHGVGPAPTCAVRQVTCTWADGGPESFPKRGGPSCARESALDLILLGGDLADNRQGVSSAGRASGPWWKSRPHDSRRSRQPRRARPVWPRSARGRGRGRPLAARPAH